MSNDKSTDWLKYAAFSFQEDIVNNFGDNCIRLEPEVTNPLGELFAEYYTGITRYKEITTLNAILRIPDEREITQLNIVNDLIVDLELSASQQEKSQILKAIKELVGPNFGASVYLSRVTSPVSK